MASGFGGKSILAHRNVNGNTKRKRTRDFVVLWCVYFKVQEERLVCGILQSLDHGLLLCLHLLERLQQSRHAVELVTLLSNLLVDGLVKLMPLLVLRIQPNSETYRLCAFIVCNDTDREG